MPATGQNNTENNALDEQTERARIARERAALAQSYDKQRQACYQQFAVTPCLSRARDAYSEAMRDLKRQEVALNDAQRKRAASDRLSHVDQRNSPHKQLEQAQRRSRAIERANKREAEHAEKIAKQRTANTPATDAAKTQISASAAGSKPQGKPRKPESNALPPSLRPGQAAKSAKAQADAAEREKQLQERRAKAQAREAQRKKASAPLPMPPAAAASTVNR